MQKIKKILAIALLIPSVSLAQNPSPDTAVYQTMCISAKNLTDLIHEFKEIPYVRGISRPVIGDGPPAALVIFVNPKDRSFTIVEKTSENVYCVLAIGNNFEPVPRDIQDDVRTEQEKGQL
jgi:hypothetical protein